MSDPVPLTPADILQTIYDGIEDWVKENNGRLTVARDPFHVLELLSESPPGFRVILNWEGDEDQTGIEEAGIVTNTISVILTRNRGLRILSGDTVLQPRPAGEPALFTLLSALRAVVRAVTFPDQVSNINLLYKRTEVQQTPEGVPLDAYRMTFELIAVVPGVEEEEKEE